jgi:sirohydrochlorin cobaltochelatase
MLIPRQAGIPLGRAHRSRPPAAATADGLLLVGHGSYCRVSVAEMHRIGDLVADAVPEAAVAVGFLEMSDPPAGVVLDQMVAAGCRRIVILPLMLLAAGHGKSDMPAIVVEGRLRHPDVNLRFGSPLGVARDLVAIAGQNLRHAGGEALPLLVIARGTSDPDANAEACRASRLTAEWNRSPVSLTGFSGVTWPLVPDALDTMATLGQDRFAVFFWFLCNGKLIERARDDMAAFARRTGAQVVDAGYFGPDPALVPLIRRRYTEALGGVATVNCDTCSYRAPFPGLEDRVGQAVGVGHSHLAADHRHHGHGHHHHRAT